MHNITGPQFQFSSLSSNAFALFQVNHPFISYFMLACCSDNWQYTWAFMSKALTSYQCNDNNFHQVFLFFLLYSAQNVFYMAPCPRVSPHRIIQIIELSNWPITGEPTTKSCPQMPHLHILKTPPGMGWWLSSAELGNPLGVKSWHVAKMGSMAIKGNCALLFSLCFHHYPV